MVVEGGWLASMTGLGADSATAGASAGSSPPAGAAASAAPGLALRLRRPRPRCLPRPWALFQRPLGPRIGACWSWSGGNRWRPEPPWCPRNTRRLSGLLATASLRLEGVRLHLGIYIYHRALVLMCLCIDAVLERNRNWVDDESIGMWLYSYIFQPTSFCEILQSAWQRQWKQFTWVEEYP